MSDAEPQPAPLREVKLRLSDATIAAWAEKREPLGFHHENAAMALVVTAFAPVPPSKIYEVLAKVVAYHPAPVRKGKGVVKP